MESDHKKKFCKCCPERRMPEPRGVHIASIHEQSWDKYIGASVKDTNCPICQTTLITINDCKIVENLEVITRWNGKIKNITNTIPVCKTCAIDIGDLNIYEYSNKVYGRNPIFPGLKFPAGYKNLPSVKLNELTK